MIFRKRLQKMLKQDLILEIVKDRPFLLGKNKNVISLLKDKLGGQIMKEFAGLKAKTYSYLKIKNDEDKTTKGTKNV